jgi:hypothetical protein
MASAPTELSPNMDYNRLLGESSKWVAPVIVLTALIVGATVGLGPSLLVLAGGMLLGVVLLFWSSVGRLTGESPLTLEEAIGLGAPSPEEERKRSILRALKDLEYERSVGKISEEDFAELSARYRADAKALLKLIDAESAPMRKRAEERLASRLRDDETAGAPRKSKKAKGARKPASVDAPASAPAEPVAPTVASKRADAAQGVPADAPVDQPVAAVPTPQPAGAACPSCSTSNDADAAFCKRCGTALTTPAGATS